MLQFAGLGLCADDLKPPREAFARNVFEIAIECVSHGHIKVRKRIADFFKLYVTALCDSQRARKNLGRILEDLIHLVMALDVEAGALELHPVRILNALGGLNAHHHVLSVGVVFAKIVAVVCGHQWNAEIFFEAKQSGMNAVLHLQALVLNFQKEVLPPEDISVSRCSRAGCVVFIFHQELGDFSFQASRERDQALRMFR